MKKEQKLVFSLSCECTLSVNKEIIPDKSINWHPENQTKYLLLHENCEGEKSIKIVNSKTREILFQFLNIDILDFNTMELSKGKIQIQVKAGKQKQLVVLVSLSKSHSDLLKKLQELIARKIPPCVEIQKQKIPRMSAAIEQKRKLKIMQEFHQTKRAKPCFTTTIHCLPFDVLKIMLEFLQKVEQLNLTRVNKKFMEVFSENINYLKLINHKITPDTLLSILTRFTKLKSLAVKSLPQIPQSFYKNNEIFLPLLTELDLSDFSALSEIAMSRFVRAAPLLNTLKLPFFSKLHSDSLLNIGIPKLSSFALTSSRLYDNFQPGTLPNKAVAEIIKRIAPTVDTLEIYGVDDSIIQALLLCKNLSSLKIIQLENIELKSLSSLPNLHKVCLCPYITSIADSCRANLIELIKAFPENQIKEITLGPLFNAKVVDELVVYHSFSLRRVALHSPYIQNEDVLEIFASCEQIEELDIRSCILLDEKIIPYVVQVPLKKFKLDFEKYQLFVNRKELEQQMPDTRIIVSTFPQI